MKTKLPLCLLHFLGTKNLSSYHAPENWKLIYVVMQSSQDFLCLLLDCSTFVSISTVGRIFFSKICDECGYASRFFKTLNLFTIEYSTWFDEKFQRWAKHLKRRNESKRNLKYTKTLAILILSKGFNWLMRTMRINNLQAFRNGYDLRFTWIIFPTQNRKKDWTLISHPEKRRCKVWRSTNT